MKKIIVSLVLFASTTWGAIDPAQRNEIIKDYAPLVRFHSEEKYFPSSVEWFLNYCSLNKKGTDTPLKPKGSVTVKDLASYTSSNYYLNLIDEEAKKGQPKHGTSFNTPCYVNFVESEKGIIIQYIFFYPFNGAFQTKMPVVGNIISAITEEFQVGDHKGDWEHITVELKKTGTGYALDTVYFARHRPSQDGGYETPELHKNTHPVVYASKYGHASHPHYGPSKAPNYDAVSTSGPEWHTWANPVYVGQKNTPTPGNEWIKFGGRWGSADNSPLTPTYQPWWRTSVFQIYKQREVATRVAAVVDLKNETTTKGSSTIKKNSKNFSMSIKPPTYIRKLYWTIENVPSGVRTNETTFSVFDKDNNKLFTITGSTMTTPYYDKEMYIGNTIFAKDPSKEGQMNVRVEFLFDDLS